MQGIEKYIQTLSEDMKAKFMACEDVESAFKLAREEGLELPDEALDAVYGGCTSYTYVWDNYNLCKTCGTGRCQLKSVGHDGFPDVYYCPVCMTTKDHDEVTPKSDRNKVKK